MSQVAERAPTTAAVMGAPRSADEGSGRAVFDVPVGDTLSVGADIAVTVLAKSGRAARLLVRAPRSMPLKMGSRF